MKIKEFNKLMDNISVKLEINGFYYGLCHTIGRYYTLKTRNLLLEDTMERLFDNGECFYWGVPNSLLYCEHTKEKHSQRIIAVEFLRQYMISEKIYKEL